MLREALTDRQWPRPRLRFAEIGVDAGRRRRHLQTEDVVQQPLAAQDRRGSIGIRGGGEHGGVGQQSAALIRVRQRDAAEAAAVDTRNPIMPREPLVDERVVGAEQVEHAAILGDRAGDKQLRFALERFEQAVVEVGIEIGMHDDFVDAAEVQPLRREHADQRVGRAPVREHPAYFLFQNLRPGQLPALGEIQQPLVGNAAPQEK